MINFDVVFSFVYFITIFLHTCVIVVFRRNNVCSVFKPEIRYKSRAELGRLLADLRHQLRVPFQLFRYLNVSSHVFRRTPRGTQQRLPVKRVLHVSIHDCGK